MIISSCLVVLAKNPVYSVLWLIFSFCNTSGLMILLNAEFLAMMLIVIYVGAVAVLFLFVIMMLDSHLYVTHQFKKNLWVSSIVALIMLIDFILIILLGTKNIPIHNNSAGLAAISNSHAIGLILYTDFILPFQMAGIILFVAMISCIILTMRHSKDVKRQDIAKQNSKNKENSIIMHNPPFNQGVEGIGYE